MLRLIIALGLIGIVAFGPTPSRAEEVPTTRSAAEQAKIVALMRSNFESLINLQPYIARRETFADAANTETIRGYINGFSDLKHAFPQKFVTQEPGFAAIGALFSEYVADIKHDFEGGSREYVRHKLRTMTGFCMSCHTRVSTDKNFQDMGLKVNDAQLTPFQKAEFLAATRQFDKAIAAYTELFATVPPSEPGLIDFTHGVKQVLSITVRVKKDPKKTVDFLTMLAQREDLPDFFRVELAAWRSDAAAWAAERPEHSALDANTLILKARKMVERAAKLQLFAADHSGDISYLRATNYIHEALQGKPSAANRGEALYLLGVSYEALQDPLLWALDELYFEQCVREYPHTNVSKKCYARYSMKIYFGYSGSGGTFVPDQEQKKLHGLRKLAE